MVVSFVVYVGRVILGGHDTIPDVFQEFGGFVAPYFPKKRLPIFCLSPGLIQYLFIAQANEPFNSSLPNPQTTKNHPENMHINPKFWGT